MPRASQTPSVFAPLAPPARDALTTVYQAVKAAMPAGFEEKTFRNMVVWQVPLAVYPDTYNKQALWYVALAPQKNYHSLYLMPVYGSEKLLDRLKRGFAAAGRKLDMGKSCIHFRTADDLDLDTICDIVRTLTMEQWIDIAKSARSLRRS